MLRSRIIPCLLIQNGGLVKTVKFAKPKYVGDPINAVRIFNEKEVDELIVLDIDGTVDKREPNFVTIQRLAAECRMPFCYGGGVTTVEQARKIIGLGVEKVALSSAIVLNPALASEIAEEVGCQSVVAVLDVKKRFLSNKYEVWIHNGKKNTKKCPFELAKKLEKQGVGEIVINSIDNDGVMKGYDHALVKHLRQQVNIPITVLGGAGSIDDIGALIKEFGVIGASAGSLFVFKGSYQAVLINYPTEQDKKGLLAC